LERLNEPTLVKGAVNEVSGGFVQPYNTKLKPLARALRSNMTDAEQCLWQRIRNRQVGGVQFYRQKTLLSFIVDFYSPGAKLVIELDGAQHFELEHQVKDQRRDAQLARAGLKVLRFDDRQMLTETEAVLRVIYDEVVKRVI
jgi:very-short-patch-repair endonuclease